MLNSKIRTLVFAAACFSSPLMALDLGALSGSGDSSGTGSDQDAYNANMNAIANGTCVANTEICYLDGMELFCSISDCGNMQSASKDLLHDDAGDLNPAYTGECDPSDAYDQYPTQYDEGCLVEQVTNRFAEDGRLAHAGWKFWAKLAGNSYWAWYTKALKSRLLARMETWCGSSGGAAYLFGWLSGPQKTRLCSSNFCTTAFGNSGNCYNVCTSAAGGTCSSGGCNHGSYNLETSDCTSLTTLGSRETWCSNKGCVYDPDSGGTGTCADRIISVCGGLL